jgi:uncharacterized protein (TIGR00297 family)
MLSSTVVHNSMSLLTDYLIEALFWAILLNLPLLIIVLRKKLLSIPGGVITGAIIGITTFIITPILWCALNVFFLTSSLVSKWNHSQKFDVAQEFAKGSARDTLQVLSNSLPAIFFGSIFFTVEFLPTILNAQPVMQISSSSWLFASFATVATHTADTWMTEIGITAKSEPRLITNPRKVVPKGTSGGITTKGTTAGMIGALMISSVYLINGLFFSDMDVFLLISRFLLLILFGILGGFIDSLEGATIQGLYYCENCEKITERNLHRCGKKTRFLKGHPLITNDVVNTSSALIAGFFALLTVNFINTLNLF